MRDGGVSARGQARDSRARRAAARRRYGGICTTRNESSSGMRNRFVRASASSNLSEPSCSRTALHTEPDSRPRTEVRSISACVSGSWASSTSSTRKSTTCRLSAPNRPTNAWRSAAARSESAARYSPGRPPLGACDEIAISRGPSPRSRRSFRSTSASAGVKPSSSARSSSSSPWARSDARGSAGSVRVASTTGSRRRVVDEPRHTVARGAVRETGGNRRGPARHHRAQPTR